MNTEVESRFYHGTEEQGEKQVKSLALKIRGLFERADRPLATFQVEELLPGFAPSSYGSTISTLHRISVLLRCPAEDRILGPRGHHVYTYTLNPEYFHLSIEDAQDRHPVFLCPTCGRAERRPENHQEAPHDLF